MASPGITPNSEYKDLPLAIDNGAFSCWLRGFPFQERPFLTHMENIFARGFAVDFIACPDIVAGGMKSLEFSLKWAERLVGGRLALVVQDGMGFDDIDDDHILKDFSFTHLFVGGTPEWKWETLKGWVEIAHLYGLKCHVGQVGTLDRLNYCKSVGVDSVDSTNFARNGSWDVVREFMEPKQMEMAR